MVYTQIQRLLGHFFFNGTATAEIYTLSLHDALPISSTCSPAATTSPSLTSPRCWRGRGPTPRPAGRPGRGGSAAVVLTGGSGRLGPGAARPARLAGGGRRAPGRRRCLAVRLPGRPGRGDPGH